MLLIYFVKAEPLDKIFFYSKKVSAYLNVFHRKKNFKGNFFKYDAQKGLRLISLYYVQ